MRSMGIAILVSTASFVLGCGCRGGIDRSVPSMQSRHLYWRMTHYGYNPRAAAKALATAEGSAPWIVLVLTSSDPMLRGEPSNETTAALDRGVIAALLESLPDDAPMPVLLAVTDQLGETGCGRY